MVLLHHVDSMPSCTVSGNHLVYRCHALIDGHLPCDVYFQFFPCKRTASILVELNVNALALHQIKEITLTSRLNYPVYGLGEFYIHRYENKTIDFEFKSPLELGLKINKRSIYPNCGMNIWLNTKAAFEGFAVLIVIFIFGLICLVICCCLFARKIIFKYLGMIEIGGESFDDKNIWDHRINEKEELLHSDTTVIL